MSLTQQVHTHYSREYYRRVEEVLSFVLNYLERDWVRQFLFRSTPESDLSILTSKQQVKHAFSGKLSSTCNDAPDSLSTFFKYNFDSNWVFIPAYSIDELAACFLIKETELRQGNTLGDGLERSYPATSLFRFVRNDDNGDTFCVMFEGDYVECLMFKWDSPEHRHNHFMRFPTDVIRDTVCADGPIDVARIAQSTLSHVYIEDHLICPKCNPFGIGVCVCRSELALKRAKYVLDFSNSAWNMAAHTGSYVGKCAPTVFPNRVPVPYAALDVFGGMVGGNEPGVIPRLLSWSISNRVMSSVVAPTKFPGSSQLAIDATPASLAEEWRQNGVVPSMDDAKENGSEHSHNADEGMEPRSGSDAGSADQPPDASLPLVSEMQPGRVFSMPQIVPAASAPGRTSTSTGAMVGNALQSAFQSAVMPPFHSSILPRVGALGYAAGSPFNVAFNPGAPTLNPIPLGTNLARLAGSDDKEAKKLQRKLRNRESAARSNRKKQLQNRELKEKLALEKGNLEKLKSRLEAVREENRALRSKLSENAE